MLFLSASIAPCSRWLPPSYPLKRWTNWVNCGFLYCGRNRLEFFRKGRDFFLHASGKAFIVTDPEDINGLLDEDIREKADDRLVLIKVRITKAEYFQSVAPHTQTGWWRDLRNQLHVWIFNTRPGYKPYQLADANIPVLSYRPVA